MQNRAHFFQNASSAVKGWGGSLFTSKEALPLRPVEVRSKEDAHVLTLAEWLIVPRRGTPLCELRQPLDRRIQFCADEMTALERRVLIDGKEQLSDLRQSSQVTQLLQVLSNCGCIAIKDAVNAPDDPDNLLDDKILQNEQILRNEVQAHEATYIFGWYLTETPF
jgi:hypothetical protein